MANHSDNWVYPNSTLRSYKTGKRFRVYGVGSNGHFGYYACLIDDETKQTYEVPVEKIKEKFFKGETDK